MKLSSVKMVGVLIEMRTGSRWNRGDRAYRFGLLVALVHNRNREKSKYLRMY